MRAYDLAIKNIESQEEYDFLLKKIRGSVDINIKGLVERMAEEVEKDHWLNRKLYTNYSQENKITRTYDAQELLTRVLFDNSYVRDKKRLYIDVVLEHLAYHISQGKSSSENSTLDNWIQAQRNYVRKGLSDIMNLIFIKD